MRRFFVIILFAPTLWLGGCADDTPPAEEVREHFQRGISGEGTLGPIDRRDDPYIHSRETEPRPF